MRRRSESPPERTAARAALTRTFETILHGKLVEMILLQLIAHAQDAMGLVSDGHSFHTGNRE